MYFQNKLAVLLTEQTVPVSSDDTLKNQTEGETVPTSPDSSDPKSSTQSPQTPKESNLTPQQLRERQIEKKKF
jgi:hypothetical protein